MTPLRGWGPRGQRLVAKAPHGHWKTLTFVAALRCDRIEAPLVFDGPINGQSFAAYVEQALAPTLNPGDIVVLDNLRSHKGAAIRATIRAAAPSFSSCRPTAPISIPSSRSSPNLNTSCATPPNAPSKRHGDASAQACPTSHPPNAQTTSGTPDMLPYESSSLSKSRVTSNALGLVNSQPAAR